MRRKTGGGGGAVPCVARSQSSRMAYISFLSTYFGKHHGELDRDLKPLFEREANIDVDGVFGLIALIHRPLDRIQQPPLPWLVAAATGKAVKTPTPMLLRPHAHLLYGIKFCKTARQLKKQRTAVKKKSPNQIKTNSHAVKETKDLRSHQCSGGTLPQSHGRPHRCQRG